MIRKGLNFRLAVAGMVLITAATFAVGAFSISLTRRLLIKRFQERMSFLAKYVALNSEVWVLVGEEGPLQRLAENLLAEQDVVEVCIFDKNGKVLVKQGVSFNGPVSSIKRPIFFRGLQGLPFLFSSQLSQPGQKGSRQIGLIQIKYSTKSIEAAMKKIALRLMWSSGFMATAAILIFLMISRSIVLPVKDLVGVAKQVAAGNLDTRATPSKLPEIKELATAFNAMLDSLAASRDALAKAEREMLRQNFLAEMGRFSLTVAHEVKNPLGIIKGSIDILRAELNLSKKHQTLIYYIEDEIKRLDRLIENFLVFARPVQPKFRAVDLNEILLEVVTRWELQCEQGSPLIEKEIPATPCTGRADFDLLSRALGNIVANAFDAAGPSGLVRVKASCGDAKWVAIIEDNGSGIPEQDLEKIFEPFFTTKSKGTGLGLAFSHQVIKAHGGVIRAENRPQGGARIIVEIGIEEDLKTNTGT